MQYSNILLATLLALPLAYAQQAADGLIVPFTSSLPACASLCGPLYDVQGACSPPNIPNTDSNCFCSDNRLSAIAGDGTTGVSSVCGATACTSPTDLQSVKSWYQSFCANSADTPSTTTAADAGTTTTATSSSTPRKSSTASSANSDEDTRPW